MLEESVRGLNLKEGGIVVDATLGGGGHAQEILERIGKNGTLIAIDQDRRAIENFKKFLESAPSWQSKVVNLVKDNFSNLKKILGDRGIKAVDAVLADLGYSSIQMEDESYGMSFLKDAQLDMRLDKDKELTARRIVNEYSQKDLERIFREYGEEKFAKSIARKIVDFRKIKPIERTLELVEIIKEAVPGSYARGKIHPATRTFQALRIEVNNELENLTKFIPEAIDALVRSGRLAVISFHSLEDRIVKNIFRENARGCICPPSFPQCRCGRKPKIKIITKKPMIPSEEEIRANPRSRSAKLRICEKM